MLRSQLPPYISDALSIKGSAALFSPAPIDNRNEMLYNKNALRRRSKL